MTALPRQERQCLEVSGDGHERRARLGQELGEALTGFLLRDCQALVSGGKHEPRRRGSRDRDLEKAEAVSLHTREGALVGLIKPLASLGNRTTRHCLLFFLLFLTVGSFHLGFTFCPPPSSESAPS